MASAKPLRGSHQSQAPHVDRCQRHSGGLAWPRTFITSLMRLALIVHIGRPSRSIVPASPIQPVDCPRVLFPSCPRVLGFTEPRVCRARSTAAQTRRAGTGNQTPLAVSSDPGALVGQRHRLLRAHAEGLCRGQLRSDHVLLSTGRRRIVGRRGRKTAGRTEERQEVNPMTSRIAVYRLTVLLSVAFFLGSAPAAEEPLMVGMAVADITPPVQQMAGPLKARCVVFRQGNEQAAVVVCDVCCFTAERSGERVGGRPKRRASSRRTSLSSRLTRTAADGTNKCRKGSCRRSRRLRPPRASHSRPRRHQARGLGVQPPLSDEGWHRPVQSGPHQRRRLL